MHNSPVATANREVHENPALLHHFATEEQQKNAASLGMWIFLATEIMFFGGMFCAYMIYRYWYFGDFGAGSQSLNVVLGGTNTAVLICSSLTVAVAVRAAQLGQQKLLVVCLVLTIILGFGFLGIKGIEYHDKFVEHHVPGASFHFPGHIPSHPDVPINQQHVQIFFSLYFIMTGLHALHMIIGIGLFAWITFMAMRRRYGPHYYTPVEIAGLYWHFVDIVWIYLFPLLYLIDLHR